MPPAKRPRGLKASSKAAAFIPPAADSEPAVDAAEGERDGEESNKRTFPLDGDALTLADIFELRTSALELLDNPTPEREEQARGLLRGILHAADVLVTLVKRDVKAGGNFFDFDMDRCDGDGYGGNASEEEKGQLKELGLLRWSAPAQVAHLQAFALQELGNHHPPPENPATVAVAGGSKRKKIDLNEPTTAEEWLDEALARHAIVADWWEGPRSGELQVTGARALDWTLQGADESCARCDRAALALFNGDEEKARTLLASRRLLSYLEDLKDWRRHRNNDEGEGHSSFEERGDPVPTVLRAITSYLAVQEGFPSALSQSESFGGLAPLRKIAAILGSKDVEYWTPESTTAEEDQNSENAEEEAEDRTRALQPEVKKRVLDVALLRGDVALAIFTVAEEAIEEKYRPEPEGADEDDEEGKVTPLPATASDVKEAQVDGKTAIELLHQSIKVLEQLGSANLVEARKAQYQKLEEAYLMLSALYNPDDEEGAKIETQLETVKAAL